MIRSWGLMLAVATQRVVVGIVVLQFEFEMADAFGTALWIALALNIAASEFWINLTRIPGIASQHWKDVDEHREESTTP